MVNLLEALVRGTMDITLEPSAEAGGAPAEAAAAEAPPVGTQGFSHLVLHSLLKADNLKLNGAIVRSAPGSRARMCFTPAEPLSPEQVQTLPFSDDFPALAPGDQGDPDEAPLLEPPVGGHREVFLPVVLPSGLVRRVSVDCVLPARAWHGASLLPPSLPGANFTVDSFLSDAYDKEELANLVAIGAQQDVRTRDEWLLKPKAWLVRTFSSACTQNLSEEFSDNLYFIGGTIQNGVEACSKDGHSIKFRKESQDEALFWFGLAASRGSTKASAALAQMYFAGRGVEGANHAMSAFWAWRAVYNFGGALGRNRDVAANVEECSSLLTRLEGDYTQSLTEDYIKPAMASLGVALPRNELSRVRVQLIFRPHLDIAAGYSGWPGKPHALVGADNIARVAHPVSWTDGNGAPAAQLALALVKMGLPWPELSQPSEAILKQMGPLPLGSSCTLVKYVTSDVDLPAAKALLKAAAGAKARAEAPGTAEVARGILEGGRLGGPLKAFDPQLFKGAPAMQAVTTITGSGDAMQERLREMHQSMRSSLESEGGTIDAGVFQVTKSGGYPDP